MQPLKDGFEYSATLAACQSTALVQTEVSQQLSGGLLLTFCTHIHGSQRKNLNSFSDPLTFHLAPSSGQYLNLTNQGDIFILVAICTFVPVVVVVVVLF